MYTRKQIPDKMKRKYRCFSIFLTVGVVLCLLGAYVYQKRISDFSGIITIEATESGFQQTGIEAIRQEQEAKRATEAERAGKKNITGKSEVFNFTAWTERKDQPVASELSGRQALADCYLLLGDSYLVLPWGKNLPADDMDGCVIGAAVAQTIFGGTEVEGQMLLYDERTLTVRGVVQEPEDILLCQMPEQAGTASLQNGTGSGNTSGYGNGSRTDADGSATFERINLLSTGESGTMSQTAEQFINSHGLEAEILHFERQQNLHWLTELIPGKWSNFSGWSTNLKTLQSDRQRLRQCEKSGIESLYMGWVDRRNIFLAAAALMAICQIICLLRAISKKHLYSES